ncbi:MAG TPA: hypothetical protein VMV69_07270 [Pirellulales bacterium]|nr:hypothetical protein [Pirellulales bacterium]
MRRTHRVSTFLALAALAAGAVSAAEDAEISPIQLEPPFRLKAGVEFIDTDAQTRRGYSRSPGGTPLARSTS